MVAERKKQVTHIKELAGPRTTDAVGNPAANPGVQVSLPAHVQGHLAARIANRAGLAWAWPLFHQQDPEMALRVDPSQPLVQAELRGAAGAGHEHHAVHHVE